MKSVAILVSIIVLLAGVYLLTHDSPKAENPEPASIQNSDTGNVESPAGEPTFEWRYRESVSTQDIPATTISLVATYPNGAVQIKEIEVIEGGCNEYEDADANVYQKSEMIICYYAGLGRYFKVVQDGSQYLVQRKVFEEASPEYNPPMQAFETIAVF